MLMDSASRDPWSVRLRGLRVHSNEAAEAGFHFVWSIDNPCPSAFIRGFVSSDWGQANPPRSKEWIQPSAGLLGNDESMKVGPAPRTTLTILALGVTALLLVEGAVRVRQWMITGRTGTIDEAFTIDPET